MVYEKKKEEEKDCIQYSGDEFKGKGLIMDRYGVHAEYCDEDEEDEG